MTLRIETTSEGENLVFRLSGRIRSEELMELKEQLEGITEKAVLDLKEVTLVDLEVVQFLGLCVTRGMELRNCAPYIRKWMEREKG